MRHYPCLRPLCLCLLVLVAMGMPPVTTAADNNDNVTESIEHNPSPLSTPLPEGVDPVTGFRMEHYRRPVPDINPGIEVVNTARALQLQQSGKVVLIDVFPPRGLGADPLDGTWLTNDDYSTLPNAVWIPEVGRGHLEQEHIDYFTRNLQALTNHNKATPIMFFCTSDCWQSWNAARRARLWGYEHIFWYPAGSDGWFEEGNELQLAEPVNFIGE